MPRIAIAGNPNAGKTSIFNALTGSTQQVSNYPGVTVDLKKGTVRAGDQTLTVVDLPGTYSLTAYSQEEVLARNYIIEEKPDLVVDVIDASNLERNLYLAIQIMEMRVPMVLVLNMVDVAAKRGFNIDAEALSEVLGVPVVKTVGNRGTGVKELLDACLEVLEKPDSAIPKPIRYGHVVDEAVEAIRYAIAKCGREELTGTQGWIAIKLLEKDEEIESFLTDLSEDEKKFVHGVVARAVGEIGSHYGDDSSTIIAERRYGIAAGALKQCQVLSGEARQNMTDSIDMIVCNRYMGPVIMVMVVAGLFFCVFKISDEWQWLPWFGGWVSPTGLMVWIFEQFSLLVAPLESRAAMLHSLIADGVIGGVGGVMEFVPLIFVMFLCISLMEDSGYVARVAFIMDRLLQTFGLQGKSILALIVSGGLGAGGCAVPGVMATRTLREEKDRLVTMLVVPFMNCGAKMPVYAMLIAAFFAEGRTQMMLLLWAISWAVTLVAALFLRKFVVRGEQTPFVMELPPYHMPVMRGVLHHTWDRTWLYIKKAGTVILAINILMWVLIYFPQLPEEEPAAAADTAAMEEQDEAAHAREAQRARDALAHSFAGRLGKGMEPVSELAGLDWKTNVALIGGFAAKEVVIGTLGTVYSMGDVDPDESHSLSNRLARDPNWNALKAFAMMVFVMIYAPCFATMVVIRRESGSWKWAIFSTVFSTVIAFLLSAVIYQVGGLFTMAL